MSEVEFIPGLSVKRPHENAPEFVKAKVSIKVSDMLAFLQSCGEEWINGDLKVSKQGKLYVSRDNWRPNQGQVDDARQAAQPSAPPADFSDEIPF